MILLLSSICEPENKGREVHMNASLARCFDQTLVITGVPSFETHGCHVRATFPTNTDRFQRGASPFLPVNEIPELFNNKV